MPKSPERKAAAEGGEESYQPEAEGFSRREILKMAAGLAAAIFAEKAGAALKIIEKATGIQETEKAAPKIHFEVFFSYHKTAEDIRGFEARLKDADVFIPEGVGRNEEHKAAMEDISSGRRSLEDLVREALKKSAEKRKNSDGPLPSFEYVLENFRRTHGGKVLEALYGSRKLVFILDLPEDHPLTPYQAQTLESLSRIKINPLDDFGKILQDHKRQVKSFADAQKAREAYFLSQLQDLKERLQKDPDEFPELKGKKEIRVLILFGSMHTKIYHHLKLSGEEVTRTFSGKELDAPYVFGSHATDILRQSYFDKEVSDELAARSLFSSFLKLFLYANVSRPPSDSRLAGLLEKSIVNEFSLEEITAIFDGAREAADYPAQTFFTLMRQKLMEKGVNIPESNEELEEMIKSTPS